MDIPLSDALFITNPRRSRVLRERDNGAKERMISRWAAGLSPKRWAAAKKSAGAGRLGTSRKSLEGLKSRDYLAFDRLFRKAGGAPALAKYKAKGRKTRAAVSDGSYSHSSWGKPSPKKTPKTPKRKNSAMKKNPRTIWHRYLKAMKGKGYSMAELRAGYKTLQRKTKNKTALLAAARKLKPKAHSAKNAAQRKGAVKARAVSKLKRVKTARGYRYFGYRNGKYGMIAKAEYDRRRKLSSKSRVKTSSRKAAKVSGAKARKARKSRKPGGVMAGVRAGRAVKKMKRVRTKSGNFMHFGYRNGKYGIISKAEYTRRMRLGATRRHSRMGGRSMRLVANPSRKSLGALALRTNGRAKKNPMVLGLLDKASMLTARVPVIGPWVAPKVTPLGVGAAVGAVHFYALRYLGPRLPEWGAKVGAMLGKEEAGYTLGESLQRVGYSIGGVMVATALALGNRYSPKFFDASTVNVLGTSAIMLGAGVDIVDYLRGDSSEPVMEEEFMGDEMNGLAYTGGQLNGLAYTGGELNGLDKSYMRASYGDAMQSSADFSAAEGNAFLRGPAVYAQRFGLPAIRQGTSSGASSMAGRHGHRWGWLVRMIGWQRAAKLASMAPNKRLSVIRSLRAQAVKLIDNTSLNGLAYTGGELNGLAYTGGELNGLAYTGGQLNGLAYTGGQLNGLGAQGAQGPQGYGALAYTGGAL